MPPVRHNNSDKRLELVKKVLDFLQYRGKSNNTYDVTFNQFVTNAIRGIMEHEKSKIPVTLQTRVKFWEDSIFKWETNFQAVVRKGKVKSVEVWKLENNEGMYLSFIPEFKGYKLGPESCRIRPCHQIPGFAKFVTNRQTQYSDIPDTIALATENSETASIQNSEGLKLRYSNIKGNYDVFTEFKRKLPGLIKDSEISICEDDWFVITHSENLSANLKFYCPMHTHAEIKPSGWKRIVVPIGTKIPIKTQFRVPVVVENDHPEEFVFYKLNLGEEQKQFRDAELLEVDLVTHMKIQTKYSHQMVTLKELKQRIPDIELNDITQIRFVTTRYLIESDVDNIENIWNWDPNCWGWRCKKFPLKDFSKENLEQLHQDKNLRVVKFYHKNTYYYFFENQDCCVILEKSSTNWMHPIWVSFGNNGNELKYNKHWMTSDVLTRIREGNLGEHWEYDSKFKVIFWNDGDDRYPIWIENNSAKMFDKISKDLNFVEQLMRSQHHIWICSNIDSNTLKWIPTEKHHAAINFAIQGTRIRDYPDMFCILVTDHTAEKILRSKLLKYWKSGLSLDVFFQGGIGLFTMILSLPVLVPAFGDMLWNATKSAMKSLIDDFTLSAKQSIASEITFQSNHPPMEISPTDDWWDLIVKGSTNLINTVMDHGTDVAEITADATNMVMVDSAAATANFAIDNVDNIQKIVGEIGANGYNMIVNKIGVDWAMITEKYDPEHIQVVSTIGEQFLEVTRNLVSISTWLLMSYKLKVMFTRIKNAIERNILIKMKQWHKTHEMNLYRLFNDSEQGNLCKQHVRDAMITSEDELDPKKIENANIARHQFLKTYKEYFKYEFIGHAGQFVSVKHQKPLRTTHLDLCYCFANITSRETKREELCEQHEKTYQSCKQCAKLKINPNLALIYSHELLVKFETMGTAMGTDCGQEKE